MLLDIQIEVLSYYSANYLSKLYIDTQDTYVSTGVSANQVVSLDLETTSAVAAYGTGYKNSDGKYIRVVLELPASIFKTVSGNTSTTTDLNKNLFYVYVTAAGTVGSDAPCGYDSLTNYALVYNKAPIYEGIMNYMQQLSQTCDIPKGLLDAYLKYEALNVSIDACNYAQVNSIWTKYLSGGLSSNGTSSTCGCNG